jgi:hypothetical protein
LSYKRKSIQAILTSLSNHLKPFIQTINIIRTTALATVTAFTDRTAEAGRANAIYIKRRTAAYKTHTKKTQALQESILNTI